MASKTTGETWGFKGSGTPCNGVYGRSYGTHRCTDTSEIILERQRWRAVAVCKTVPFGVDRFKSYLQYQILKGEDIMHKHVECHCSYCEEQSHISGSICSRAGCREIIPPSGQLKLALGV